MRKYPFDPVRQWHSNEDKSAKTGLKNHQVEDVEDLFRATELPLGGCEPSSKDEAPAEPSWKRITPLAGLPRDYQKSTSSRAKTSRRKKGILRLQVPSDCTSRNAGHVKVKHRLILDHRLNSCRIHPPPLDDWNPPVLIS